MIYLVRVSLLFLAIVCFAAKVAFGADKPHPRQKETIRPGLSRVDSLAFDPTGKTLAMGGVRREGELLHGEVIVRDIATGTERGRLKGHSSTVYGLFFTPDGKTIITAGFDKTVRIWNAVTFTERLLLRGHKESIRSAALSPDGKLLATADFHAVVRIWDVQAGKERAVIEVKRMPGGIDVAFSPDGKNLAIGSFAGILLWDVVMGKDRMRFQPKCLTDSVAFSPDGKTIAAGGHEEILLTRVGVVRLYDATSAGERGTWLVSTRGVMSVRFSGNGKVAAMSAADKVIVLWDVAKGRRLADLRGHTGLAFALVFSPDGKTVASGGIDGSVILWDAQ